MRNTRDLRAAVGPARASRRGSVLLIALLLASVVVVLCAGLVGVVRSSNAGQRQATDTKEAFQVAEAGLAEAFTGLKLARSGNVGSIDRPAVFGDGLFWVEARTLDGGLVELESTGMVGSGRATLQLHARRAEEHVGALGIFSDASLLLPEGTFVDGYDSRLGTYLDQLATGATAGRGRVGSNVDVVVSGGTLGTTVDGEATPGVSGTVVLDGAATVTGPTSGRSSSVTLPSLTPPATEGAGSVRHENLTPLYVPSGDQRLTSLELGVGAEVVLLGPATLTVGTLVAEEGSRLLLDTTAGGVDLVVTESAEFRPLSRLETSSEDTTMASVLVSAPDELGAPALVLDAHSRFHGSIFAPEATVRIGADFELFGALAAKELQLESGARLHFDHALADPALHGANRPRVVSWRVVDIPLEINQRALSPFDLLGVDRASLPGPAEAHADQLLEIVYVDLGGAVRSYVGPESGFDFASVQSVVSATRDGEAVEPATALVGAAAVGAPRASTVAADVQDALQNLTGSALRDALVASSPLTNGELVSTIVADVLDESDLVQVLDAQRALSDGALAQLVQKSPLTDTKLRDVLVAASPLSTDILAFVLDGTASLGPADVTAVLAAQ